MRILLSVLFLLFSYAAFAEDYGSCLDNTDESTSCNTSDESDYGQKCIEYSGTLQLFSGQYYEDESGDVANCPIGMYCPGDGAAYCCDKNVPGFRFSNHVEVGSSWAGARSKYECYKKLDKLPTEETEAGHGLRCITKDGTYFTGACREYYRDNTSVNAGYIGTSNHNWVVCKDDFEVAENEWSYAGNSIAGYIDPSFINAFGTSTSSNIYDKLRWNALSHTINIGTTGSNHYVSIGGQSGGAHDPDRFHMEGEVCYQNALVSGMFRSVLYDYSTTQYEIDSAFDASAQTSNTISRKCQLDYHPTGENDNYLTWRVSGQTIKWDALDITGSHADYFCNIQSESLPSVGVPNTSTWLDIVKYGSNSYETSKYIKDMCSLKSVTLAGLRGNPGVVDGEYDGTVAGTTIGYNYYSDKHEWQCSGCPAGSVGFFLYTGNSCSNSANAHINGMYCKKVRKGCYSTGCVASSDSSEQPVCLDPHNYDDCMLLQRMDYNNSYNSTEAACVFYLCDAPFGSHNPGQWGYWDSREIWHSENMCNSSYRKLQEFTHACYAGQTTDDSGKTSILDCRYGIETVFFDAYGTFQLPVFVDSDSEDYRSKWWYEPGFDDDHRQ